MKYVWNNKETGRMDPVSFVLHPNPVKENKSIPKIYTHDTAYSIVSNDVLFEKGLTIDNMLQMRPHKQANINISRLLDWGKAIANNTSTVNMLDILAASVNKELIKAIQVSSGRR